MKRAAQTLDVWTGRDPSRTADLPGGEGRRRLVLLIGGCLLAGLLLAALRVDLIRVRYGLGEAVRQEKALLEEHREALAQLRTLRDPARLARLARERGFARPARIIDLERSGTVHP